MAAKKGVPAGAAILLILFLIFAGIPLALVALVLLLSPSSAAACAPGVTSSATSTFLDDEQAGNAATIIGVAKSGFTDSAVQRRAAVIGLITAMQESGLRNIDYGDRDSIGLFQQRPSMSWGSVEEIMIPAYSAGRFYKALVGVPGWAGMELGVAAQTVQRSGFPDAYDQHIEMGQGVVAELFEAVSPVAIPLAVDWAGEDGSAASGAEGGCVPTGELGLPLAEGYGMTDNYGPRGAIAGASSWHPAVDLTGNCGTPVLAMASGTVTENGRLYLSVRSDAGFTISYLHTPPGERLVEVGAQVATGQQIAVIGNEPPSTGCHLDVRVDPGESTDPRILAIQADPNARPYINPEEFTLAFGVELCPAEWCTRF